MFDIPAAIAGWLLIDWVKIAAAAGGRECQWEGEFLDLEMDASFGVGAVVAERARILVIWLFS